jgi:hypothetical protein
MLDSQGPPSFFLATGQTGQTISGRQVSNIGEINFTTRSEVSHPNYIFFPLLIFYYLCLHA